MYWISEHSIYHLRGCRLRLPSKIPTRSTVVVMVQPEIPHLLRDNFALSLALLLVLFNPLVLVNSIHELAYTVDRFLVKNFLKPCSVGMPSLKVLTTTSLKLPLTLLNISQYLSE